MLVPCGDGVCLLWIVVDTTLHNNGTKKVPCNRFIHYHSKILTLYTSNIAGALLRSPIARLKVPLPKESSACSQNLLDTMVVALVPLLQWALGSSGWGC